MNQNPKNVNQAEGEEREALIVNYLLIVLKWRKLILINFVVVTALAVAVSFILPKTYKATTAILPPKDQEVLSVSSTASSVLRNITGVPRLGGLGQKLGAYNYMAILNSRSAMEIVVNKFELARVYNIGDKSMEKAIRVLRDNVEFTFQDEEYITIDVLDEDPQRAADIANYFVDVLNDVSHRLGSQEARNNREFIEKRVAKCKEDLHFSEEALREFQEKTGMLISREEGNSSISAVAELYALKAKKELEIGILERTVTKDNPLLQGLKIELSEVAKKVNLIPEAGIGALRLYRDVAIQQRILEFLIPVFEQSKVDEQKEVPVILLLDKAVPPEKKFKPKRLIIVVTAMGLSLLASLFLVLWREYMESLKNKRQHDFAVLQKEFSEFKNDLKVFGRKNS